MERVPNRRWTGSTVGLKEPVVVEQDKAKIAGRRLRSSKRCRGLGINYGRGEEEQQQQSEIAALYLRIGGLPFIYCQGGCQEGGRGVRWRSNDGTGAQQEMDGSRVDLLNKSCRGLGINYERGRLQQQSEIAGST